MWDRKLINAIFNFSYKWEVYTPVKQRKYGYYVLPVLYGNRFIARIEPQFNKKNGQLIIKNWWWEEGVKVKSEMKSQIINSLQDFKNYLGASEITGIEMIGI